MLKKVGLILFAVCLLVPVYLVKVAQAETVTNNVNILALNFPTGTEHFPEFSNEINDYDVYMDSSAVNMYYLAVMSQDPNQTRDYQVNGGGWINIGDWTSSGNFLINQGTTNLVEVRITSADRLTTRTINLYVHSPLSTDPDLRHLVPSVGTLSPAFDKNTDAYEVHVPNTTSSLTLKAKLNDGKGSMKVKGVTTTSGTDSAPIPLDVGSNVVTIDTLSQSNGNSKHYKVDIIREPDLTAPTVSSGTINASNVTTQGVTLNWAKATDNVSPSSSLQYQVYRSDSANMDTVSNIEANGTVIGSYTADIGTYNVTGLAPGTTYYFNVIVKDTSGNKSAYTMQSVTTKSVYTVTYDGNGATSGSVPTDSKVYEEGAAVTVAGNTGSLVKPGYTFAGWNTMADGSGTRYNPDASFEVGVSNITLYAQWHSANAMLSGLAVDQGTVTPAFTSANLNYSVNTANPSITVTPSTAESHATMTVNGDVVASGHASKAINLNVGSNVITIVVTAQDGTTRTYTITVTRVSAGTGGGSSSPTTTPPSDNSPLISTDGKLTLPAGRSGVVSLEDAVSVSVPAGAADRELRLTIGKVLNTGALLKGNEVLATPVYEIIKNFSENFSKPVTLSFSFNPASLNGAKLSVFYYDEAKKEWVEVGGKVDGNHIIAEVNHFTKFAVIAVSQTSDVSTTDPSTDTKPMIKLSDISGHWAEAYIKQAVDSGIVRGYQDGTFKPNQSVTRAEFAVMLMNTLMPQGEGAPLTFTDAGKISAWAKKAVAQAVQAGIIGGYEDGSFRPDAEITRSEMAAMVAKALGQSATSASSTGFADDKNIPAWAKSAVAALKQLAIIEGKGLNEFAPAATTTRAEAVTVLLKLQAHKSKQR
ncbi:Endo-1,4-beta-xylanase A precursor [compost metagenome]